MRVKTDNRRRTAEALARVKLSNAERLAAEDALEKGELIADLILGAMAAIRSAMQRIERGLRDMAGPTG